VGMERRRGAADRGGVVSCRACWLRRAARCRVRAAPFRRAGRVGGWGSDLARPRCALNGDDETCGQREFLRVLSTVAERSGVRRPPFRGRRSSIPTAAPARAPPGGDPHAWTTPGPVSGLPATCWRVRRGGAVYVNASNAPFTKPTAASSAMSPRSQPPDPGKLHAPAGPSGLREPAARSSLPSSRRRARAGPSLSVARIGILAGPFQSAQPRASGPGRPEALVQLSSTGVVLMPGGLPAATRRRSEPNPGRRAASVDMFVRLLATARETSARGVHASRSSGPRPVRSNRRIPGGGPSIATAPVNELTFIVGGDMAYEHWHCPLGRDPEGRCWRLSLATVAVAEARGPAPGATDIARARLPGGAARRQLGALLRQCASRIDERPPRVRRVPSGVFAARGPADPLKPPQSVPYEDS